MKSILGVLAVGVSLAIPAAAANAIGEAEIENRYRQVLSVLAAGDDAGALAALAKLEADATPRGEPSEVDILFRAKVRTLRDVLDEQAEVLVPVIMLHHDGYLYYRSRAAPFLAAHSRQMVEEMSVLYAKRADTEGARVTAARILTSLGGHLLDASMTSSALSNFNQALVLDPRDSAALRSLGVLAEKVGRLDEAKSIFERLLSIAPDDPEAKVRLALIAGKMKDTDDAAEGLRQAIASPATPAWLAELAVQELGQLLADQNRLPQATQVVHRGVERFPASQRLLIQLSYLHERQGQRGQALEAAENAAALSVTEPTPRWRYNRWPQDDMIAVRKSLRESVAPRLQLLAAALAASGTGSAAQAASAGGGAF